MTNLTMEALSNTRFMMAMGNTFVQKIVCFPLHTTTVYIFGSYGTDFFVDTLNMNPYFRNIFVNLSILRSDQNMSRNKLINIGRRVKYNYGFHANNFIKNGVEMKPLNLISPVYNRGKLSSDASFQRCFQILITGFKKQFLNKNK
jgi:hypothetical protein